MPGERAPKRGTDPASAPGEDRRFLVNEPILARPTAARAGMAVVPGQSAGGRLDRRNRVCPPRRYHRVTYLLQRARVGERLAVSKAIEASGNLPLANKETERRKRRSAARARREAARRSPPGCGRDEPGGASLARNEHWGSGRATGRACPKEPGGVDLRGSNGIIWIACGARPATYAGTRPGSITSRLAPMVARSPRPATIRPLGSGIPRWASPD